MRNNERLFFGDYSTIERNGTSVVWCLEHKTEKGETLFTRDTSLCSWIVRDSLLASDIFQASQSSSSFRGFSHEKER